MIRRNFPANRLAGCVIPALLIAVANIPARAAEKSADQLLPESTIAYVEIAQPTELLHAVLEHPLRKRLEANESYRTALNSPQYRQLLLGVAFVESQLGMGWQEAIETLTEGGIYAGLDANTQGVALLVKARDEKSLKNAVDVLVAFARNNASNSGQPDPVKTGEYKGVTAYQINDGTFAAVGSWLLVTNKNELGKTLVDSFVEGEGRSLADNDQYQAARKAVVGKPVAWAWLNAEAARQTDPGREVLKEKSDNPVLEVLLGGVVSTLRHTPFATASLYFDHERLAVALAAPHDPTWVEKPRQYFFGPDGNGTAPTPLIPRGTLLNIGAYRDMGGMWMAKEELFEENITAQLAQADSNLSTFFSGRDFGREVLGAFDPQIQIVATRQTFEDEESSPDVRIPAFAFVFRLKDPDAMHRPLRVSFQSLVGFLNVVGGQNGQPLLDLVFEKRGEGEIVGTSYLPGDVEPGRINHNFSPSVGFVGETMIVASTRQLAGELVDLAAARAEKQAVENEKRPNSEIVLDLAVLRDVLTDNKKHLVAQNMLQQGHGEEEASKQIDALLTLLDAGQSASLSLNNDQKSVRIELSIDFATDKSVD